MTSRIIIGLLTLTAGLASQAAASTDTLVTEPDQGLTPIYNLIASAKSTLEMTMYELTDNQAEALLAQAAASGVTVRVILDQNLEMRNNAAAYNYLNSHGVEVHWANKTYSATHQKTITVDSSATAIMTLNLTSQYYPTDRDFVVIENDPNDIAAIQATFDADFLSSAVTPPQESDLVWSPTNSQSVIVSLINSAQHGLLVENEEMGDTAVTNALISAAQRGVLVQVVMTNTDGEYATEFTQLVAAGVEVSTYAYTASLYIHAKVILGDYGHSNAQVFIGSQNFSTASLNKNRELGLILRDPAILESIEHTLGSDFAGGTPWAGNQSGSATVVNAASLQPGFASAGWVTIFGTNLSPVTESWVDSIVHGTLPTSLDGVTVTIAGAPAYPAYISPTQIDALAPDVGTGTVTVTVKAPNGVSTTAMADAQTFQPAFFQWGSYAVATHQDFTYAVKNGTVLGSTVPAAPGDVIILWGTGFGPTTPAAPVGTEVPSGTTYHTASPVTVTLGSTPAAVYSTTLAPGTAGSYQVAIQIPESLASGDYPVVATVAGVQSPANVLLTVQGSTSHPGATLRATAAETAR
jgi:cardiolipin synthase